MAGVRAVTEARRDTVRLGPGDALSVDGDRGPAARLRSSIVASDSRRSIVVRRDAVADADCPSIVARRDADGLVAGDLSCVSGDLARGDDPVDSGGSLGWSPRTPAGYQSSGCPDAGLIGEGWADS